MCVYLVFVTAGGVCAVRATYIGMSLSDCGCLFVCWVHPYPFLYHEEEWRASLSAVLYPANGEALSAPAAGWQQICNGRQEQMETPLWFWSQAWSWESAPPARMLMWTPLPPASRHHWPARGLSLALHDRRRMREDTQQSTRRERQSPHLACRTRGRSKRVLVILGS